MRKKKLTKKTLQKTTKKVAQKASGKVEVLCRKCEQIIKVAPLTKGHTYIHNNCGGWVDLVT